MSVVVPTRNSGRTLEACLQSLRAQSHVPIEVIVVDNSSDDETREIAARWADVVLAGGPERSTQRNVGAAAAQGSHLLFVDSDMTLASGIVGECLVAARRGVSAVVIPEESVGEGFWARCKALERSCYVGDEDIEAARFFRRSAFAALGGYDERLRGPEDWDIHARALGTGVVIARITTLIQHDEGRLKLRGLLAKKFRYGTTAGHYLRTHRSRARAQARLFRPAFLRHRRRLLAQPLAAMGMFFMKTLELAAGGAGVAVGTLQMMRARGTREPGGQRGED